jgi:hypothetical protein
MAIMNSELVRAWQEGVMAQFNPLKNGISIFRQPCGFGFLQARIKKVMSHVCLAGFQHVLHILL